MFEGEYLNGKRWNAKGKEFNEYTKITINKEYLNGKIWYMIEYDESNNIINELLIRTGLIQEYDFENNLIYKCEYLNGEKN